jgi:hypothetical protein
VGWRDFRDGCEAKIVTGRRGTAALDSDSDSNFSEEQTLRTMIKHHKILESRIQI